MMPAPKVAFVPGLGVFVDTALDGWVRVKPDGTTHHITDIDDYLGAVPMVLVSQLGDLEHGTAQAMRFAAVEVAMLENRTNSYSTNIAELLETDADRLEADATARKRAEEYAAEHVVFWQGTAPGTEASIVDALLGFAGEEAKS